ncbi:DNA-binding transcriptional regulator, LysR family [Sulfitobacter marinus]|uniref:DNA-binding transcriptional regulator, LysR family n=1 Tax=Sulfitobacter marinus TaxID=394264 RepID=A0A1I6TBK8_9RHOB|nr:LysR family transcriptional regulator [Sulfitobacter marinus]SFS86513.1 DNA-binding transcriptional regulator, LysR family [Sulfitobacter marinus]
MYNRLSWDDISLIHAIRSTETLSGAARALGVSHPTIYRKLNLIEDKLGAVFFQRSRTGYTPTAAAIEICDLFDRLRHEVDITERQITGQDSRPSGSVRLTTTDSLLFGWLGQALASFGKKYPDIELSVVVSNDFLNLTRREADLAIRPSSTIPHSMSVQKVGVIKQAVYASQDMLSRDLGDVDLSRLAWIGPDDSIHYPTLQNWMRINGYDQLCRYRSNSVLDMFWATKHGIGVSVLPCYLADECEDLTRHGTFLPELATDLWLVTHPDLRKSERIRLLIDWINAAGQGVFR